MSSSSSSSPLPTTPATPAFTTDASLAVPTQAPAAHQRQLAKYDTGVKGEAIIGPMPDSMEATIKLLKDECPSVRKVPSADISLALQVQVEDHPSPIPTTRDFRILPQAWPIATTQDLPLITVKTSQVGAAAPQSTCAQRQSSEVPIINGRPLDLAHEAHLVTFDSSPNKTWDDLVKEGALLGIH